VERAATRNRSIIVTDSTDKLQSCSLADQRHGDIDRTEQTRRRLCPKVRTLSVTLASCCLPRPVPLPPLRATPLALEHGFEPDVVVRTAAVAVGSRCREMVGAGRAIGGEGRRVPAARRPLVPGALLLPVLSGAGAADHKRCGIRFLCCSKGC
jgi:hypothetical protein